MAKRQIKNARDLSTNELIYFKGHAKATYMSDGSTVENAVNNLKQTIFNTNKIFYETSDNSILEPNAENVFGANIVSNTYENGIGVITFDADVTQIGENAFQGCTSLTNITIGNSVTSIGNAAFNFCISLTDINIPDSVNSIGVSAFGFCNGLTNITIPDSVTSIGGWAFAGCRSLQSFNGTLASNDNRCLIIDSKLVGFAPAGLTEYIIPDNVTEIGGGAFYNCTGLTNITIPDSVTSIGEGAFFNCNGLTNVTIGSGVASIGINAFNGCSKLTDIIIPDNVTEIGNNAFNNCSSLTSIVVNATIPSTIGADAIPLNSGLIIYVPNGTVEQYKTSWVDYANYIVEKSNSIIYYKTSDNSTLEPYKTDVFGANIVSNTYENGVGIITFDADITTIGDSAFVGRNSLTSIIIPDSVINIGRNAFGNCTSLQSFNSTLASSDNRCLIIDNKLVAFAPAGLTEYIIPDNVTEIGTYAFRYCNRLINITIPYGVTTIGSHAFEDCSSLTNITIPDSVTSIGGSAFAACSKLTDIIIPDGVTSIGDSAFNGCNSLTNVTLGSGVTAIGNHTFHGCSSLTNITIPDNVTSIGGYAFGGCSGLTDIEINATVPPTIGDSAFTINNGLIIYVPNGTVEQYKSSWVDYSNYIVEKSNSIIYYKTSDNSILTPNAENVFGANIISNTYENGVGVITFDADVTQIGNNAFGGCSGLTNIIISDSVTSIDNYAFRRCSSLTNITIPDGVTSIGRSVFNGCSGLTNITIPDGVTEIGVYAFQGCNSLINITIPDSVTKISDSAFSGCTSLTNVTLGSGVTSIGHNAFEYCTGLTNITIPDSVTSIGKYAFNNCTGLTNITIGNGVTSIGKYAFNNCTGLTNIVIPDSVTSIGEGVLGGCKNMHSIISKLYSNDNRCLIINNKLVAFAPVGLTEYNIPDNVTEIGNLTFKDNDNLSRIIIPENVTKIGDAAFYGCSSLTNVTIPDSVTRIGEYAFMGCRSLTNMVIPNKITIINKNTFYGCTSLTNVIIGSEVTSIAESAFAGCYDLTSVTIPDKVTSIGSWSFHGCNNLINIIIPDNVTFIGDYAFGYCSRLTNINIPNNVTILGRHAFIGCRSLTNVTIGSGVTKIEEGVFYECASLTNIIIPNSVTEIGKYAFAVCSNLTNITIPNSVTKVGNYVFSDCNSLTSITIPDSVTEIGEGAFDRCNSLTNIEINTTVPPTIGDSAITVNSKLLIYVPFNSLELYKSSWVDYANYIVCAVNSRTIRTINGISLIGYGNIDLCYDSITYDFLKSLRDNSQLKPGLWYRITDYNTVINVENADFPLKSAGHRFDVLVLATSEKTLSEDARAIQNDNDTYFDNSNLSAWRIWYCLDNDSNRFDWADSENGKGVIYRMIDEWGNDCPYDFKNIMCGVYKIIGAAPNLEKMIGYYTLMPINMEVDTENIYYSYTFCMLDEYDGLAHDVSVEQTKYCTTPSVFGNVIGECFMEKHVLIPNVFVSDTTLSQIDEEYNNKNFTGYALNKFASFCAGNVMHDAFCGNQMGYMSQVNIFGSSCTFNTFGAMCISNVIGSGFNNNKIGDSFTANMFGDNYICNTFGANIMSNIFGDNYSLNIFGNVVYGCQFINSSGDTISNVTNNTFGNNITEMIFINDDTSSENMNITNYKICNNIQSQTLYLTRELPYEVKVSKNSNGEIIKYCEADLFDSSLDSGVNLTSIINNA